MRTTANKYVLQIDNWDNDSASAYKNVTLLANLINVERQKDIFDMVKNTLSKKNGELFDVATHNLAHLFSKIRTKTILYEMYKTDIGSLLNIDKFFSDYTSLKNANDVVGINMICKEFAEATKICYQENANSLIRIKANPSENYASILKTMNENGEKEFSETNIYSFIVNDYNNYRSLANDYNNYIVNNLQK